MISSDQIHVAMTKTCGMVVTPTCQSNIFLLKTNMKKWEQDIFMHNNAIIISKYNWEALCKSETNNGIRTPSNGSKGAERWDSMLAMHEPAQDTLGGKKLYESSLCVNTILRSMIFDRGLVKLMVTRSELDFAFENLYQREQYSDMYIICLHYGWH